MLINHIILPNLSDHLYSHHRDSNVEQINLPHLIYSFIDFCFSSLSTNPGYQRWQFGTGGGLVIAGSGVANILATIPADNYEAGEILRFSWIVDEANTMTLTSTLINNVIANLANTPDTYPITVPADGNHQFNFALEFAYTGDIPTITAYLALLRQEAVRHH